MYILYVYIYFLRQSFCTRLCLLDILSCNLGHVHIQWPTSKCVFDSSFHPIPCVKKTPSKLPRVKHGSFLKKPRIPVFYLY